MRPAQNVFAVNDQRLESDRGMIMAEGSQCSDSVVADTYEKPGDSIGTKEARCNVAISIF